MGNSNPDKILLAPISTEFPIYQSSNTVYNSVMTKTILVVDDKTSVRLLFNEYLTEKGYHQETID